MMQLRKRLLGKPVEKIHSIAALLVGRGFEGSFEAGAATYRITYSPSMARLAGRKLELVGRLRVTDSAGATRTRDNVKALLVSTQGGIGGAPPRPRPATLQPAAPSPQQPGSAQGRPLPEVEATDHLSFCGALYFKLDPLDGRALAVRADLSRVQLNARLFTTDEPARSLHGAYSAIVDALYKGEPDERTAGAFVGELNRLLGGA